jgi:hypothetical protein
MRTGSVRIALLALLSGCGGGASPGDTSPAGEDRAAAFSPLEVGADYRSWKMVNTQPFLSPTHGKRFVNIYVNEVGLAAYTGEAEFPVGTIIVKDSFESQGGKPSEVAGPLFVMEKRRAGYAPEHQDWYYALYWSNVPPDWVDRMGGVRQVHWRSPSPKIDYCWKCHENYDREVGLPPEPLRAW